MTLLLENGPLGGALLGAALGYGYFRFVGCRSNACLLSSRWWTATAYGALVGVMMAR